jgi:hypothetical protein
MRFAGVDRIARADLVAGGALPRWTIGLGQQAAVHGRAVPELALQAPSNREIAGQLKQLNCTAQELLFVSGLAAGYLDPLFEDQVVSRCP